MNKTLVSVIAAIILLLCAIINAVLFAGCCKAPEGLSALATVLDGCNKKSETTIMKGFSDILSYSPSFSTCVTPDDYLQNIGISFDYMDEEGNVTEKFYIIGTAPEDEEVAELNSLSSYKTTEAYIAADYKDADGNTHTAMTTVTFTVNAGKIIYII